MSTSLTSTGVTFTDGTTQSSAAVGFGQTWQDMTAARVSGTIYTNTTGRPIQVLATLPDTGGASPSASVLVDGVQVLSVNYDDGGLFGTCIPSFIVPNGANYAVTVSNRGTISRWVELR